MNKQLKVYLHDKWVGNLFYEQGKLTFQYDLNYITKQSARPISATMPLGQEIYPPAIVVPFFSGLLPDDAVRYRLAKYLHLSDKNIFGLLEAIGGECAGAISIKPMEKQHPSSDTFDYVVLSEKEAFDVMQSLEKRPFLVGETDIRISAAGAQCKLMIAFVDGKIAIPKGDTPSTHMIKPNIPGFNDTVWNEYFCMTLAKKVGLITPSVQVIELESTPFYVVERYDRITENGKIKRLHQEDFCQLLNIPPEMKYENEGGPSLVDCFVAMDQWIQAGKMPGVDKLRLLRLAIFNYIIGNTDAHGKNFSIVYQNQGMVFAPCYDLLSTIVYSTSGKDKMAMKIGGEYQLQLIQKKHWEKLATQIGIKSAFLFQQIKKMACDIQHHLPILKTHSNSKEKIIEVIEQQIKKISSMIP